jgi:hypothetical protein
MTFEDTRLNADREINTKNVSAVCKIREEVRLSGIYVDKPTLFSDVMTEPQQNIEIGHNQS